MEEAILTILASLALAGVTFIIGFAVGTDKQTDKLAELNMDNVLKKQHIDELVEKNRTLMKQLNEKENVSRETSYNKSYGLPEVVDWTNQQFPTGGDK